MTAIAQELDAKLKKLDAETAASVERLVRDALSLVDKAGNIPEQLPPDFWEKIRSDWGNEPFERPSQGTFEVRENW